MASETFQDAAVLDQLLGQALSPIDTYGRGLLSLAIAKRNREQQLQDAQRIREQQVQDMAMRREQQLQDIKEQERFTTEMDLIAARRQQERDIAQRGFQRQQLELTNKGRIDLEKEMYRIANDAKKQELFDQQKADAVANGLKLPANATYEDYVQANANASGEKISSAIKTVYNTSQALAAARGQTREELRRDQMSRALATIPKSVTKKLTAAQINSLITDPNAIGQLMDRASRLNDKELLQALADINGQVQTATSEMLTKAVNDKAITQELKDQNDTAQQVLQSLLKNNRYPASAIIDAFKGYGQAALGGPTAQASPAPNQRPALPTNLLTAPIPPTPQTALTPVTNVDMKALQQVPVVTPESLSPPPGATNDQAKMRLRRFLQDQSSVRSALTPTAFPGFIVPPTFQSDNPLLQPQP